MPVFGDYAKFYDNLYEDKDYAAECDFVEETYARFSPRPVKIVLDLGCGTGGHAIILAQRGYSLTGIDRSDVMLAEARKKMARQKFDLHLGDVRTIRLDRQFDSVISMFAVMSYMTTNDDLAAVFATVSKHLVPGGLFIFDSWFGPGVFSDLPTPRIKEIVTGEERIIRLTRPEMDVIRQVVSVNFHVLRFKGKQVLEEVKETHLMRPLFLQEILLLGRQNGLQLAQVCEFLEMNRQPSLKTWNISVVLKKVE